MNAENHLFPGSTTTALGHQLKYLHNNVWYKIDHYGYEAAAEYISSHLAKYTNIPNVIPYNITTASINGVEYTACSSPNFLEDDILVSSADLFTKFRNIDIDSAIDNMDTKDKIIFFVSSIEEITGIENYGTLLSQMLDYDAFILNEGRTFNNIHFLYNEQHGFSPAPLFDFGDSFLSNTRDKYPHTLSFKDIVHSIKAKPFDTDFLKQISVCHSLYGKHLCIDKSISISQEMSNSIRSFYGNYVCDRISYLLDRQISLHRDDFIDSHTSIFKRSFSEQLQAAEIYSKRIQKNHKTKDDFFDR